MVPEPTSLQEAIVYFANSKNCREYVVARRWPNGVECPTCGCKDVIFLASQNRWQCRNKHSTRQFSLKTSWFMDHRIRFSLGMGPGNKLSGQVEADETFIGGKARNMHASKRARVITGTGGKDEAAVLGILERGNKTVGGKIRTKVVGNTRKSTLQAEVRDHVLSGSALSTDSLKSYEGLGEFQHEVVATL